MTACDVERLGFMITVEAAEPSARTYFRGNQTQQDHPQRSGAGRLRCTAAGHRQEKFFIAGQARRAEAQHDQRSVQVRP
jgi:hypothetical protein